MNIYEQYMTEANDAGEKAVNECKVTPMYVGKETFPFSGVIDKTEPMEYVSDGPCGFAWINIKPGNSKFANWLKKNGHASKDHYRGGVTISVPKYNQSLQKKEVYAAEFAKILRSYDIKAYSFSRMD